MTQPPDAPTPADPALPASAHAKRWTLFSQEGTDRGGAVLGDRFEVGELLGAGGTAWVYACRDQALRSMAAIKILKASGEDARRRFIEEGRILANLRHPHLVQVLAVGETDAKAPFMVLELLAGQSLDERLRKEGPLPWREVVELVAQAAGALAALHHVGVIHRDVKPGNIVQIGSATSRPLVKLIDLGIAKVLDWQRVQSGGFEPVERHQTEAGLVVGTPGFYPPEASCMDPDPRFDTFALGVTIYLLCTGQMPDLLEPRRMSEVRPACGAPPELEALVATALAILPEDRIATAEEFQRRLETIRVTHTGDSSPYLFDGCYELLELRGAGAKAEVYRAYHRDAARYVALKLLSARSMADPEECVRFAREARALSVARHPALPELVDCRTSPQRKEQPYIAMALAPGKRASEFCVGPKCLGAADVIAVGRQLAGALAVLHAHGILHRDLHTGNVLIDLGRETRATLIDVGMVEFMDAYYAVVDQRYPTPPEHRVKLGTGGLEHLEWTAPEARATKVWTPKCDVYSLGLLLYRLLTGKRPTTREPVSPRKLVPACPGTLASALLSALHEDPAERVDVAGLLEKLDAAADEMAEDACDDSEVVEEHAAGPLAAPTVPPVRAGKAHESERPRRSALPLAATIALGAAVLGLGWWAGAVTATPTSTPGECPSVAVVPEPQVRETQPAPPAVESVPTRSDVKQEPPPILPTMHEALEAVEPKLRRCAAIVGGLLLVEFTADRGVFTEALASGSTDPRVASCIRDATAASRFESAPLQVFTEGYTP
jgi:serine/threonine protein kinase